MHRATAKEQVELNALKTHINTGDEQLNFDALALKSTPQRFHQLFPLCMQLGADL